MCARTLLAPSYALLLTCADLHTASHPAPSTIHAARHLHLAGCFQLPHLLHVIAASLSLLVFIVMAAAFQLAELELNMVTRNVMAMAHSK